MFQNSPAFSGFSVSNIKEAEAFYSKTLGLTVEDTGMGLQIHIAGSTPVFIYEKPNHVPAEFTVLNFPVGDIDAAIEDLASRGVQMVRYEGMEGQDELGVMRGRSVNMGPDIAWFTDPAGNVLSILQN